MCIACTEFIKGTLTFKEFNAALRETTMEDSAHLRDVEATLATSPQADPEAAKKKLRDLAARRNP